MNKTGVIVAVCFAAGVALSTVVQKCGGGPPEPSPTPEPTCEGTPAP